MLEGDNPVKSGFVSEYKDGFLRVTEWGDLEESDIGRSEIYIYSEDGAEIQTL